MPRRAAHVDVDDVGTRLFGDFRAFAHPARLATRKLYDVWPYSRRFAAQPGNRPSLGEIVAGSHLGDHKSRAQTFGQTSKRRIGHARHRREKNSVGESNIAYFQRLRV